MIVGITYWRSNLGSYKQYGIGTHFHACYLLTNMVDSRYEPPRPKVYWPHSNVGWGPGNEIKGALSEVAL